VGLVLDDWNWCFSALPFFDLDHPPRGMSCFRCTLHTSHSHLPIYPSRLICSLSTCRGDDTVLSNHHRRRPIALARVGMA
jgi:hypothetical protein